MADPIISIENVTKLYGAVIGVNDISLSLPSGAYGLLGPNGSGKTTLLNLITGQLRPTLGRVRVFGDDPPNNAAMLSRLGVCPAYETLYSNVSGGDWIRFLMELHGFSRAEAITRAEESLDKVGMAEAMHRPMGSYSRGMRQRTKIAQALAHDPDLLILDEPFNGLDPVGRHDMTKLLRRWADGGRLLLLASHILYEVEAITNSFLLICGGRLLASATADEVHSLLADVPNEIRIRCDAPARLARRLLEEDVVEAIRFLDDGQVLVLSTRNPATVYERFPSWIESTGIKVAEFKSGNDSLETLFDTLLRIHRGEIG